MQALSATAKNTLRHLTDIINKRNEGITERDKKYTDLMRTTEQLAREKDADKRSADDRIHSLTEEVKVLKAKHKQQAKIQELEEAAQHVLLGQHAQHAQQPMHNSAAAPAPVLQVPPLIEWDLPPDEVDEMCAHADESDVEMHEMPREETADPDLTQADAEPQQGAPAPGTLIGSEDMARTFIRHGPDGKRDRALVLGSTLQEPWGQATAAPSMRAKMPRKAAAGGPMKRGKAGKRKPLSRDSGNILKYLPAAGK
ncbi:hypothetical protein WJX72_005940 [[Myrmecia] bisecta]|uniref:Uncharacterized protein n=1 Tax=[Myrmecia] bisecta TaxID=41462 RepID=A0AAW1P007_9CHLO